MDLEIRQLCFCFFLNAVVFCNASWLAFLLGGWKTRAEHLFDCFQYFIALIVTGFLVLHFAHRVAPSGLIAFHLAAAIVLGLLAHKRGWRWHGLSAVEPIRGLGWTMQILVCIFLGWLFAYIYYFRDGPPTGWDALVYHLTKPVQWLRETRLSLVPLPFADPTCAYAPIDGELFFAWLLAPFGNDVLARFGQMPFLAASLLVLYSIWRRWYLPRWLALGCAGMILVFRPFVRQLALLDVDVILATWFLAFILSWQRLDERWQSWARCGIALGLLIGTKAVGLVYFVPCLALVLVKQCELRRAALPIRAVPHLAWLAPGILLLGGFTYVRNWVVTGDPFYPASLSLAGLRLFPGIMDASAMSASHLDFGTIFHFLFSNTGTFTMPKLTAVIWGMSVAAVALVCCLRGNLSAGRRDLVRLWFLGLSSFALFLWTVPYLDERLLFPIHAMGFLGIGWLLHRVCTNLGTWAGVAILGGMAVCLMCESVPTRTILGLSALFSVLLLFLLRAILVLPRLGGNRKSRILRIAIPVVVFCAVELLWVPYVRVYQDLKFIFYPGVYPGCGEVWLWLNEHTKGRGATVAYAGLPLVYPLFGQDLQNSIVYVPVQKVARIHLHEQPWPSGQRFQSSAPSIEASVRFREMVVGVSRQNPDPEAWLKRVQEARAQYLVIIPDIGLDFFEGHWAEQHPDLFHKTFERDGAVIYRIGR